MQALVLSAEQLVYLLGSGQLVIKQMPKRWIAANSSWTDGGIPPVTREASKKAETRLKVARRSLKSLGSGVDDTVKSSTPKSLG